MNKRWIVSFLLLPLLWMRADAAVDHKLWDTILKANVDKHGYVDYAGIRINRGGDLYQYITLLEEADVKSMTDDEKLCFWINAYNAHVLKFVLAHPKMEKANDDLAMFDKKFKLAKLNLTLNDIEHRILRSDPNKGGSAGALSMKEVEPRIHFALCNGALGCPKLRNGAYFPIGLKERLEANVKEYVNSPEGLKFENGKVILSSVLNWYEKDFEKVGGLGNYLASLLDPKVRPDADAIKTTLQTNPPANVEYQFDWTLNNIQNKK